MNDVTPESRNLTVTRRGCACRLHSTFCVLGQPTPVDVVFAATIHADDGAVMVVVRQGPLTGAPYNVEGGQVGCTHQNVSECTRLFAKRGDDLAGFADRAANDLANGITSAFRKTGTTIGGEAIDIEHCY